MRQFGDLRSGLLIFFVVLCSVVRGEVPGLLFCRVLRLLVEVSGLVQPVRAGRAARRANAAAS
jgi:hypothetical protein